MPTAAIDKVKRISVESLKAALGEERALEIITKTRVHDMMSRGKPLTLEDVAATRQFINRDINPKTVSIAGRVLRFYVLNAGYGMRAGLTRWLDNMETAIKEHPNGMVTMSMNGHREKPKVVRKKRRARKP